METLCASFPPVGMPDCRVLVLGSMPGVASLQAQKYYAHPRNAFWPVLYALWDEKIPDTHYEARLAFVTAHRVAVWDVAKTCVRSGSSDASMWDVQANDFAGFFAQCPAVHTIFCNGRLAEVLFRRLAMGTAGNRTIVPLPSTSPAYTLPFDAKLAAWRAVREAAEREIKP